ncbi:hypothetical protein GCM10007100_40220 [Roseibacillus persicicus]|uniref:Uncharacterized protein n=2 Tax=Roseibacillus persicicus TaxID=454148 RepID=A0A918TXZ0_9BACT|nr:hypothetical protein GCM10007100_40220 [Roseibacillus persicicus]
MPHGKVLLLGASGTVQGRLGRWFNPTLTDVCNEFDELLKKRRWLEAIGDFDTIHHVIRFGQNDEPEIEFGRISKKYSELPTASLRSMSGLHEVYLDRQELRNYLQAEVLRSLQIIGERFSLSWP